MRHATHVLLAVAAIGVCIVIYTTSVTEHRIALVVHPDSGEARVDVKVERAYWIERVEAAGGLVSYREFGRSVSGIPLLTSHIAAHVFGDALYDVEGLAGISVCDNTYGQGCRHSVLARAIQEYGVDMGVVKLAAICAKESDVVNKRTCEHAIGHGLTSYEGYSDDGLLRALDSCTRIKTDTDYTLGCAGGAYMEYNLRPLLRVENIGIRELTSENIYEPCSLLPAKQRSSCMFWQPEWWYNVLLKGTGLPSQDILQSVGRYCSGSTFGQTPRRACFRGIGYMIGWVSNGDAEFAARACTDASSAMEDRLECWQYTGGQLARADAELHASTVCEDLESMQYTYCMAHKMDIVHLNMDIDPLLQGDL